MKKSMTLVSTVVVAAGCIGVSFASASQQNPTFQSLKTTSALVTLMDGKSLDDNQLLTFSDNDNLAHDMNYHLSSVPTYIAVRSVDLQRGAYIFKIAGGNYSTGQFVFNGDSKTLSLNGNQLERLAPTFQSLNTTYAVVTLMDGKSLDNNQLLTFSANGHQPHNMNFHLTTIPSYIAVRSVDGHHGADIYKIAGGDYATGKFVFNGKLGTLTLNGVALNKVN